MLTPSQQSLVIQHMDSANKCARYWKRRDEQIPFEDFKQEALFGMIRAATHYNKNNKASFNSYAFSFMHGAIKRMRSIWYTNKKDGFEKNRPVPTWVLLDHPNKENSDEEGNWYAKNTGIVQFNPVLMEELQEWVNTNNNKELKVKEEEISKQKEIAKYLVDIKAYMKEKKISITALAKKIGINQSTMSRWLSNTVGLNEASRQKIDTALNNRS